MVEAELLKNRPSRGGRVMPIEASDFAAKSALYLPHEAQFDYLVNLSDDHPLGEAVNHAMTLVEEQSEQLTGTLPKSYTMFSDELLRELLRIFNNKTLDEIGGDVIGRIYEYFLSKFAKAVASDDGCNDRILMCDGQLKNWLTYLRANPYRWLVRRECTHLMKRSLCIVIGGIRYDGFGNFMLLRHPEKGQVFFHRRMEEKRAESGYRTDALLEKGA